MACPDCTTAAQRPEWGGYRMQCLECCARLVAKTAPDRHQAAVMLAAVRLAIRHLQPGFTVAAVSEKARELLAQRT